MKLSYIYLIKEAAWPKAWAELYLDDPKFIDWLKTLGVEGELHSPKEGGVGRTYQIGDSFIIKFTTDNKEASAALTIGGFDSQYSAKIYGVRTLGTFILSKPRREVTLYVIVMEKLNTGVGKKYKIAGASVYNYLDNNSGKIVNPRNMINIIMDKYLPKKYKQDAAVKIAIARLVNSLYQLQQQTGILSQDPHGGNLAFKNRNPAFFDYGRSLNQALSTN